MRFTFKKSYFIVISVFISFISVFTFQNCTQTKFSSVGTSEAFSVIPVSPVCDVSKRLSDFENIQCQAPNQSQLLARQFYNVICDENGEWSRVIRGPADYSQCPNSCRGVRPSDVENIFCPVPNSSVKGGVQRYTVTCLQEGSWSRIIAGAPDYTACRGVCNPNDRPSTTSQVACPAPNSSLLSGVQNYTVTCNSDGTWGRSILGGVDYSLCPQSCDPNAKPPSTANEKCPATADIKAIRNYNVICMSNGRWSSTPTTLDTSLCPSPTCDPNTRPGAQETVACPAPFASSLLAKQNYSVSCSGTQWVKNPTTRDDSQCPKSCGAQPANDFTLVACQAPFQSTVQGKQNYTYTCNTTTGQHDRVATGAIDYTNCPKSCSGPNPAERKVVACPVGTTGTAYQNYSSTCNTTTGQWTTPVPTGSPDNSGCRAVTCTGTPPTNFDPVACPAPFQSRMDAKKMYAVATCVNGSWVRGAATGVIDTAACPVNDCTGSANPGTEKDIGACPAGATGRIYQTCSLTCTGNTYTQTNCSADNYSRCDCGPSATFSVVTRTCVTTTPTYTYAWDPNAISRGACSATACGTSGTQSGTYTTCRRSDGAIVAGSYCGSNVAPAQSCSAPACSSYSCQGTVPTNASMCAGDNQNLISNVNNILVPACTAAKCEYTCNSGSLILGGSCQTCNAGNASAWYLEANPDVKSAGVDALTHWCQFGKNEGRAGCFQASQCPVLVPKSCVRIKLDVYELAYNWPGVPQQSPTNPGTVYTREVSGFIRDVSNPTKYVRLYAASHSYNESNYLFALCEAGMTDSDMLEKSAALNPNIYLHAKFWEEFGFVRGYNPGTEPNPYKRADYGGNFPNRICGDLGGQWSGNNSDFTLRTDGFLKIKCTFTVPDNSGG
jgi:hypothetical protein